MNLRKRIDNSFFYCSSNNNQRQHRVYSPSTTQNENTQVNYRRNDDSLQSHATNEYSRSDPRTNNQFPSQTNIQYTQQNSSPFYPHQSSVSPPSRGLQPPLQTSPQHNSDVTINQQQGPYTDSLHTGRAFQSVQPLANPITTQHHGNLVHSSPSYSRTKIYSSQQSNPQHTGIYPDVSSGSSNQYNPSRRDSEDIEQTQQTNRQSHSNKGVHNFDQTMDLLDSYANYDTARRVDGQSGRTNVMSVNSNRDHEVPIYNRPERTDLRFTPRIADDLETEGTEHSEVVKDALRLMFSPYTRSATLKNDEVDEMTSKILSTVANETVHVSTLDGVTVEAEGQYDEIVKDEPVQSESFMSVR